MAQLERGRFVMFEPPDAVGNEQKKRRPWVIVSGARELNVTGVVVLCCATSQPSKPTLARWYVPFAADDVRGKPMLPGGFWIHQLRTISPHRLQDGDILESRLTESALNRLLMACTTLFAGHG